MNIRASAFALIQRVPPGIEPVRATLWLTDLQHYEHLKPILEQHGVKHVVIGKRVLLRGSPSKVNNTILELQKQPVEFEWRLH